MAIQQTKLLLTNDIIQALKLVANSRPCQRKSYNIYAVAAPAGFIFANKLEQPETYAFMLNTFKTCWVNSVKLSPQVLQKLKSMPHYETDGNRLVLCGTRGELWTITPEKFKTTYTNTNGSPITKEPITWTAISRIKETQPNAVGIQIPANVLAGYNTSRGDFLQMNHPATPGHYKGDILIIGNDGSISPTNNEVFALTYNLQIGGWANSGLIRPIKEIVPMTAYKVANHYKI